MSPTKMLALESPFAGDVTIDFRFFDRGTNYGFLTEDSAD